MNGNLHPIPSLDALASDPTKIDGLPLEVLRSLWVNVHNLDKAMTLRLLTAPATASPVEDRLLKIGEAAPILGTTVDHLYRHHDKYPFTVKDGNSLRFSSLGIQRWIKARLRQG